MSEDNQATEALVAEFQETMQSIRDELAKAHRLKPFDKSFRAVGFAFHSD